MSGTGSLLITIRKGNQPLADDFGETRGGATWTDDPLPEADEEDVEATDPKVNADAANHAKRTPMPEVAPPEPFGSKPPQLAPVMLADAPTTYNTELLDQDDAQPPGCGHEFFENDEAPPRVPLNATVTAPASDSPPLPPSAKSEILHGPYWWENPTLWVLAGIGVCVVAGLCWPF